MSTPQITITDTSLYPPISYQGNMTMTSTSGSWTSATNTNPLMVSTHALPLESSSTKSKTGHLGRDILNTSKFPSTSPRETSDERTDFLLKKAFLSKDIKELYDQAFNTLCSGKDEKLSIVFSSDIKRTEYSKIDFLNRKILLSSSLNQDEALTSFVYRLTHIVYFPMIKKNNTDAKNGMINCEDYVKKIAQIKFSMRFLQHQTMSSAIKKMGWSPRLDGFSSKAGQSFEDFWRSYKLYPDAIYRRQKYQKWQELLVQKKKGEKTEQLLKEKTTKKVSSNDTTVTQSQSSSSISSTETNEKRAKKLLQKALSCQSVRNLYELASQVPYLGKVGKPTIFFSSDPEKSLMIDTDALNRRITLSSQLSEDEALSAFVFELTNFLFFQIFQKINENIMNGKVTCEKYIKKIARIEFNSRLKHHKIMEEAIKEAHWSPSLDRFSSQETQSFTDFWSSYKSSPNAQHKKQVWLEIIEALRKAESNY